MYTPVAQRGAPTKASGYVPVAKRDAAPAAPVLQVPPLTIGPMSGSTPMAILPPASNFQTIGGKNTYTPMPAPRQIAARLVPNKVTYIPNTTISPGEPTPLNAATRSLPEWLSSPVRKIVMDIQEGLFGDEKQRASVKQIEDQGGDIPITDSSRGLVGFIFPSLSKSDGEKIEDLSRTLEDKGTDPARAAQIAFYSVFGNTSGPPGSEALKQSKQANERLAALNPTPDEKSAAFWANLFQKGGDVLDVAGVLPVGALTRSARLAETLRLLPNTAEGIAEAQRVLTQAGVAEDIARQAAPKFASLTDTKSVEAGLDAIEKLQNSTKPSTYTPVAKRAGAIEPVAKALEPLAIEARKYKTAGEFTDSMNKILQGNKEVDHPVKKAAGQLNQEVTDRLYGGVRRTVTEADQEVYKKEFADFYEKAKTMPESAAPARANTKLEKLAQESSSFNDFARRSGVGIDTLDATAQKKGFTDARDFFAKTKVQAGKLPQLPKLSEAARAILNPEGMTQEKAAIGEMKTGRDILRDAADNMPAKGLLKYESPATEQLPEVIGKETKESLTGSGKKIKAGEFSQRGDDIVTQHGFKTPEEAQKALDDYKSLRKQVKSAEQSVRDRVKAYSDRKAVFDELVRHVNAQGKARRDRIEAVEDFFKFNPEDMKALMKGERDVRLMSDQQFEDFMKKLEGRATERYFRNQALNELNATILEKELKKTDNIRQVLRLPKLENMSVGQLRDFNDFMQQFKVGDEFLSVRKLQTVEHTDLKGIYTLREARERLLEQVNKERDIAGKPHATMEELENIKVAELDRYRYDTALARRNPLYGLMVQEKNKAFLNAEMTVLDAKERVDELFDAARKSRKRGVVDRLIPTDNLIFKWLESPDADKLKLAEDMTHEELEAAMYIRDQYAEMRDYLLQQKVLKKFRSDYITHIQRGFLEAWKEEGTYVKGMVSGEKQGRIRRAGSGLLAAFKEVFKKYVQEEAYFNILDQATDQVLPLEKFFQYSMHRTGELVPSKNVAKAFTQYLSTFEKKKALDSIIPKLDIYVHSLTPKRLTPRGLEFDASLKKFFKEWMNSKKGRVTSNALIKPGGKMDFALRTGVALTRILDLGLSIPVGIASNLGAQAAVYRGLGEKAYALGQMRMLSKQGRDIVHTYRAFAGEPVYAKARSSTSTLGDNLMSGVFGLFSLADRKARQVYLLGKMTPEEFKAGKLSTDKLARLQTELGRHLPIEGAESIIGKTALGKIGTQYKSWAVPLLSSTIDDLSKAGRAIKTGDASYLKSTEFGELVRTAVISAVVGFGAYGVLSDKRPMKEKSFAEKMAIKAAQDALSLVGALDPTLWTQTPRLAQFLGDLATAAKQIVLIEKNKKGELMGINKLESTLTPGVVRQIEKEATPATTNKKSPAASLPKLPKLPTLPKLPKLPKI